MASAAHGEELSCSTCPDLSMKLATLRCGHRFCRDCLVTALDTQEGSGVYPCPGCREEYVECPVPVKKIKLSNTVEDSRSMEQENSEVFCTYCVHFRVAAIKTCLHCETSMCDKHLTAHNKAVDHVLVEPTSSFRRKKCSIHEKLLEYYCPEDAICLCVSCCLVGKHKGHEVELIKEALEKKKERLRNICEKVTAVRGAIEGQIQNLQDHKGKAQEKANNEKKRVTVLYEDIRRQLEVQEQRVLSEISRQEEKVSLAVSELIQQLETQKDTLSRKIRHIEEMCNITDPITVLQEPGIVDQAMEEPKICDLDDFLISLTLHRSLTDLITNIKAKNEFHVANVLLDEKTAHESLVLSADLKMASVSDPEEDPPDPEEDTPDPEEDTPYLEEDTPYLEEDTPDPEERFYEYWQVMSIESFSSGRHYWEVEIGGNEVWDIGVCYPTIDRGPDGDFRKNNKSWCIALSDDELAAVHNSDFESLNHESPLQKVGVYLDYEGGRLSFYQLSDPIRHLHTFTTTFTEPLHAAFYLDENGWVKLLS
ncbi:E3 ubiquitin-protein ligase TRIM39-like [Rana temporaria]|uniref:E3 ubiquitin-protein ligase TRIM39-like n=1 Tax=Rana temporaria TaxID=8407 RepID=UPI001AACB4C8|nr:E3 ubiquitin-protein ligase TRIM39-like [Rana temporaria]